jgi:malate synthase
MDREFLSNYLRKVVSVCHKRGAIATGGMAAHLINDLKDNSDLEII